MTLAIAHRQGERAVLDVIREVRPPFSPEATVQEFTELLHAYRLGPDVNLAAGSSCLGLHQIENQDPQIGHYCLGVEGFDHEQILQKLADHGVRGTVNDAEPPILVFTDPDGIVVQLQDENYCRDLGLEP